MTCVSPPSVRLPTMECSSATPLLLRVVAASTAPKAPLRCVRKMFSRNNRNDKVIFDDSSNSTERTTMMDDRGLLIDDDCDGMGVSSNSSRQQPRVRFAEKEEIFSVDRLDLPYFTKSDYVRTQESMHEMAKYHRDLGWGQVLDFYLPQSFNAVDAERVTILAVNVPQVRGAEQLLNKKQGMLRHFGRKRHVRRVLQAQKAWKRKHSFSSKRIPCVGLFSQMEEELAQVASTSSVPSTVMAHMMGLADQLAECPKIASDYKMSATDAWQAALL